MDKWQPIETAPRPATGVDKVLLCEADAEGVVVKIGYWDGERWNIGEPFMDDWTWAHWMPLPEPPNSL